MLRRLGDAGEARRVLHRQLFHRARRELLRSHGRVRVTAGLRLRLLPGHAERRHHWGRRLDRGRGAGGMPSPAASRALSLPPRVPAASVRRGDRPHAPLPPARTLAGLRAAVPLRASAKRLLTRGLTVRFGGLEALARVDVAVAPGETLGVIGPNGSGKTTLFNAITGLYRPASGEVELEGRPLVGLETHAIARLGI